jgi:predicted DNA-binding protein
MQIRCKPDCYEYLKLISKVQKKPISVVLKDIIQIHIKYNEIFPKRRAKKLKGENYVIEE